MRVSITYDERRAGIIFPATFAFLIITIDFSDEEKETIRARRLEYTWADGFCRDDLTTPNIKTVRWWNALPVVGDYFARFPRGVYLYEMLIHRTFIIRSHDVAYLKQKEHAILEGLEYLREWLKDQREVRSNRIVEL